MYGSLKNPPKAEPEIGDLDIKFYVGEIPASLMRYQAQTYEVVYTRPDLSKRG